MQSFKARRFTPEQPEPQDLWAHQEHTAAYTEALLRPFSDPTVAQYGKVAGYLHDLGKYDTHVQLHRLNWNSKRGEGAPDAPRFPAEHSSAGGLLMAAELHMNRARRSELPFVITAHHSGLWDMTHLKTRLSPTELKRAQSLYATAAKENPRLHTAVMALATLPDLPFEGRDRAHLIRFLLSALVEADRTDAREQRLPSERQLRGAETRRINTLRKLSTNLRAPAAFARAAHAPRGSYALPGSLSPTDALRVALRHAAANGLRRVFHVSAQDDTAPAARAFRSVLPDEHLIYEHVTDFPPDALPDPAQVTEPPNSAEADAEHPHPNRPTAEGSAALWGRAVVVTSAAHLFGGTLFAAGTAQLRRAHHLASSVLIIEDPGCLDTAWLPELMAALDFLVRRAGCSVLFTGVPHVNMPPGTRPLRFLPPDAEPNLILHPSTQESRPGLSPEGVASEALGRPQVLTVAPTPDAAQAIHTHLQTQDKGSALLLHEHLSAAQREAVLNTAHDRLRSGQTCRLTCTPTTARTHLPFPDVLAPMDRLPDLYATGQKAQRVTAYRRAPGSPSQVSVAEQEATQRALRRAPQTLTASTLLDYQEGLRRTISQDPPVATRHGTLSASRAQAELHFRALALAARPAQHTPVLLDHPDAARALRSFQRSATPRGQTRAYEKLQRHARLGP